MKTDSNEHNYDEQIAFLQAHLGIDVSQHLTNEAIDEDERITNIRVDIMRVLLNRLKRADHEGKFALPMDFDTEAYIASNVKGNKFECTCNLLFTTDMTQRLKSATGMQICTVIEDIHKFGKNAVKICAEGESNECTEKLATEMVNYGIEAIAVCAGNVAIGELISTGVDVAKSVAATIVGIKTMNFQAVAEAVQVIVNIFSSFLGANKTLMGLILNETPYNIAVKNWQKGFDGGKVKDCDLYMAHGKMVEYMHDTSEKTSGVQLAAMPGYSSDDEKCKMVYGGMYEMSNRTWATVGVCCVMKLDVKPDTTIDFYSTSPYKQKGNGVNMKINNGRGDDVHKVCDELAKDRAVMKTVNGRGLKMKAEVHDKSASRAYMIATISESN